MKQPILVPLVLALTLLSGCSDPSAEESIVKFAGAAVEELEDDGQPTGVAHQAGAQLVIQVTSLIADIVTKRGNCDEEQVRSLGGSINSRDSLAYIDYSKAMVDAMDSLCHGGAPVSGERQQAWIDSVIDLYVSKYEHGRP